MMDFGLCSLNCMTTIGVIIASIFAFVIYKFQKAHRYFADRNIPHIKPKFIFGGDYKTMIMQRPIEDEFDDMYNAMPNEKIFGYFQFMKHGFVVKDPVLVEKILVKDFTHFQDHMGKVDVKLNPLDGHLFNLTGDNWKTMRTKLSPIFTSGKLKWMFEQIVKCSDDLLDVFRTHSSGNDFQHKPIISSYGLDVIASCAFGIEVRAQKHPNSEFCQMVKRISNPGKLQMFKLFYRFFSPKFLDFLKIKSLPEDINDFFLNITKETIRDRLENDKIRNDFVQLLIQLKQKGFVEYDETDKEEAEELGGNPDNIKDNKFEFTDEVLAAQSFIFFLAGLETVSVLTGYGFFLLSTHRDIQEKVREEINAKIAAHGGITYDALKKMTYLDLILSETLRLFPPSLLLLRKCTKTYTTGSITIEKGSGVMIPVKSLHYDSQYFDDPQSFKPERFIDSKYSMTHSHGVYLPFGDGPRVCIARRFALLQSKMAFVKILQNFELLASSKNINPYKHDPASLTIIPKEGLHLRIKMLKKVD